MAILTADPPSLHATELTRAERRDQIWVLSMMGPGLLLMIALVVGPFVWLAMVSLIGSDNQVGIENYVRVFQDSAYAKSLWLTLWMSASVTGLAAVLGYTLAYAISCMPPRLAGLCLLLVALPFWTGVLVRTYAWLMLLQYTGIVNKALMSIGIIDEPLAMMHNATGALIGMFHIMLPFMVFPLYATLRGVDPDYRQAAESLGASRFRSFWSVFFPQTLPGLIAGSLLVFILCLGFYITPALLGGGKTIVFSIALERDVRLNMDWGPAAAVAVLFVASIFLIFALAARFVSLDRIFQR
ncbi:MAG: ABC transporter permease [Pseudomonadota bacterium]|nr:ABC transporter permease [Pseudomonadota bacterium]